MGARQPPVRRTADATEDIRLALGNAWSRSLPALLTGLLAALGAAGVIALPAGSFPVRIGAVLIVLAVGLGLSVLRERTLARPYWVLMLCAVLILMPTLALQASTSREPFVSLMLGSAGPLLWLTFASGLILAAFWLYAALQSTDAPGDASLLFLPAALLVPGALGAQGRVGETSILAIRGESIAKDRDIVVKLIPTPRHLSSDCGIALRVEACDVDALKSVFEERCLEFDRVAPVRPA